MLKLTYYEFKKRMKELLKHNEQISVVAKLSTTIFDMLQLKRFADKSFRLKLVLLTLEFHFNPIVDIAA